MGEPPSPRSVAALSSASGGDSSSVSGVIHLSVPGGVR